MTRREARRLLREGIKHADAMEPKLRAVFESDEADHVCYRAARSPSSPATSARDFAVR